MLCLLKHWGSLDVLQFGTLCTAWKDGRLVKINTERSSVAIHIASYSDNLSARISYRARCNLVRKTCKKKKFPQRVINQPLFNILTRN